MTRQRRRGSVVPTNTFNASSCAALKKLALPPTSKLVTPSMPRCSNSLCQPRIVSSFNSRASATSWQLHPPSSKTRAFARRVTRDAADPSRANAISLLRSSTLRKPPRIMPHPNPPSRKVQQISPGPSMSQGIAAVDVDERLVVLVAPADRLALLVGRELRLAAELDASGQRACRCRTYADDYSNDACSG